MHAAGAKTRLWLWPWTSSASKAMGCRTMWLSLCCCIAKVSLWIAASLKPGPLHFLRLYMSETPQLPARQVGHGFCWNQAGLHAANLVEPVASLQLGSANTPVSCTGLAYTSGACIHKGRDASCLHVRRDLCSSSPSVTGCEHSCRTYACV